MKEGFEKILLTSLSLFTSKTRAFVLTRADLVLYVHCLPKTAHEVQGLEESHLIRAIRQFRQAV
jgi:hypothetical protein